MNEMVGPTPKNIVKSYSKVLKGQWHKKTDGHIPCKSCHDAVTFNSNRS